MSAEATLFLGDVVTPHRVLPAGGVLVAAGRIAEVYAEQDLPAPSDGVGRVRDLRGSYLFPGVVDAHVHSFSEPREGFRAATRAAAAGGVTTVIDMPYDAAGPVNSPEALAEKITLIPEQAHVDVALHGTVRPGSGGDQIAAMVEAGACGFKVSLFETDPVRFPRIDDAELLRLLGRSREAGVVVGVHAEDGEIIGSLVAEALAGGSTRPVDHCLTRPPVSETASVALGLSIARAVGAPFHVFHVSLPESIDLIEAARSAGQDVSAETCPHYLLLSEDDMEALGARGKINPPLRGVDRVQALWQRLADGAIDMVTSDHAPWRLDRKADAQNIFANASGAPGVQTLAPLLLSEGFGAGRMSLLRLAAVLSENPARRFRLGHRKGRIEVGMDADLVVFDPGVRWNVSAQEQESQAGWTPYEGRAMTGRITETIVRGHTVYADGRVTTAAGTFVRGA